MEIEENICFRCMVKDCDERVFIDSLRCGVRKCHNFNDIPDSTKELKLVDNTCMKESEAIKIFNNYRDYVNDGSKVTIHYEQVKTMVEAYGVLEKVILDLREENNNVDCGLGNIQNIIDFLQCSNLNPLMEIVSQDLDINIDYELSCLYCYIKEQRITVSFKDIIEATNNRIITAIKTFTELDTK